MTSGDPIGKIFFNILATLMEFESDPIRLHTREGMQIARAKGRRRGEQPWLSDKQQIELGRMHGTGQYTISDLAESFSISRSTVYRTLLRPLSHNHPSYLLLVSCSLRTSLWSKCARLTTPHAPRCDDLTYLIRAFSLPPVLPIWTRVPACRPDHLPACV